ncbi:zinc metalloprotease [Aeoliella mucimassa]|uniref:Matrixin n=1 Tax=Aeoliella mucimassa TaxID=2527972 RepID=A0A518AJD3_9BACT|nr:hypothetical protein [Aeoliella mucimassa]QDU54832.1 hypothetical protein Pan181_10150 [Aeoliella mucimassa]
MWSYSKASDNSRSTVRRKRLSCERLEPRVVLDASGGLVGVDPHFTLSFTPDGTQVGRETSTLQATFDSIAPTADWQEAILRAFQTWAIHTNADIGLVDDGGQPFGVPAASQHDSRFGDIRIGTSALSPEVGAVSVPINNLGSGSWLTDVIFNTQFDYQSIDDVLAVAMHEAGNVFGLADSAEPLSPLHSHVTPQVLSPTATDIANLQNLHGVRVDDAYENHSREGGSSAGDNDSFANATHLNPAEAYGAAEGTGPTIVYGDLTTLADQDYFVIKVPGDYQGSMSVQLKTQGISLLQPELTVYNANEHQLLQTTSNLVGGALLNAQLPSVSSDQEYYVRVDAATQDIFAIGGYSLSITFDDRNLVDQSLIDDLMSGTYRSLSQDELTTFFDSDDDDHLNEDDHTDDHLAEGVELETTLGFAEGTRYETFASISDASDADVYSIKSPPSDIGLLNVMTVSVRSLDAGGLVPQVTVFTEDRESMGIFVKRGFLGDHHFLLLSDVLFR